MHSTVWSTVGSGNTNKVQCIKSWEWLSNGLATGKDIPAPSTRTLKWVLFMVRTSEWQSEVGSKWTIVCYLKKISMVGVQTCTTTLEISMVVSQKTGNQPTSGPSIYPKDDQSYYKDICSTMFIAALFVIARTWKQPGCLSTEEWMQKIWYIYTMEY